MFLLVESGCEELKGVTHRCAFARFYKKWGKRL